MTKTAGIESLLAPVTRKVNLAVWLNATLVPVGIVVAIFATTLLLMKMLVPSRSAYSFYLLAGVPIALVYGYLRCRRNNLFFNKYQIGEIVDHLYLNDGSVTTSLEKPELISPTELYLLLIREMKRRMVRLDLLFYTRRSIPVLAYAILAVAVPARTIAAPAGTQEILATVTQPLYEKLEMNEEMIPEEERTALEKDLKELAESKEGISKEKWEAVEEMEKRIEQAGKEAESNLDHLLTDLSSLSESETKSGNAQTNSQDQARLDQLAKNIGMQIQSGNIPLTAKQRQDLSKLLEQMNQGQGMRGDIQKKLAELKKELAGRMQQMGEGQNGPKGDQPGRGGVERGRADAAMAYGDERKLDKAKVEEKEIENQFLSAEDLADLGITPIEPSVDPGKFSPGTIQNFQTQEGSAVSRSRISPSQKDAVAGYFSNQ